MRPARNQGDGHQGEVLFLFVGKKCELRFFRSRSSLMANGYPVGFTVFAEVVREEPVTRRGSFYNCQVAFLNLTLPDQRTHPSGCARSLCKEHHTARLASEPVPKPQKCTSPRVVLAS